MSEENRPNPLGAAANKAALVWSGLAGVIGALAAFNVIDNAQVDAINTAGAAASPTLLALGTVVGGLIPIVTALGSAFHTARAARPEVTPVADPRNNAGQQLAPVVPGGIGGVA